VAPCGLSSIFLELPLFIGRAALIIQKCFSRNYFVKFVALEQLSRLNMMEQDIHTSDRHLTIRNLGPIHLADINMKRVNVVIGEQSSGKSCLLKTASYCAKVEERIKIEQSADYFKQGDAFIRLFIQFHKMGDFVNDIATHSPYILGKMLESTDYDFGLFYIQPGNDGMSEVREATEQDIQEIYEDGVDAFFNMEARQKL
jgi:hypothetical protein